MPQEGFDRIEAHVRRHGGGVEAEVLEHRLRIHQRGVADVAALGVADGDHLRGNGVQRATDDLMSIDAHGFIERQVELVALHEVRGGLDDGAVEGDHRLHAAAEMDGNFRGIGIESHAHQAVGRARGGVEFFVE